MANKFPKTIGGPVSKTDAQKWIADYDNEYRRDKDKDTISIFYGADAINEILAMDGVTGISFFLCSKQNDAVGKKTVQLVLVGRKEDGTLLWDSNGAGKDGSGSGPSDNGLTCPPICN